MLYRACSLFSNSKHLPTKRINTGHSPVRLMTLAVHVLARFTALPWATSVMILTKPVLHWEFPVSSPILEVARFHTPLPHTLEALLILESKKPVSTVLYPRLNRSVQSCFGSTPQPVQVRVSCRTLARMLHSWTLLPLKHAAERPKGSTKPAQPEHAGPQPAGRHRHQQPRPQPPPRGHSTPRAGPRPVPPHLPRRASGSYISSRFWKLMLAYALRSSPQWPLPRCWPGGFGGSGCFASAGACGWWWRRWPQSLTKSRSM